MFIMYIFLYISRISQLKIKMPHMYKENKETENHFEDFILKNEKSNGGRSEKCFCYDNIFTVIQC